MRLKTSARAERELDDLIDWLALRSPAAARRMAYRYLESIELLTDFPLLGHALDSGARELPIDFGRDGLIVRYILRRDHILILRVLHGRQDR